jgi:hypothetical protein
MKHIYLLLILIFSAAVLSAAPLNTLVVNNGNWQSATSWSLGQIPASGDSVLIPAGFTVTVNSYLDYSASTFNISVYGVLFVTQSGTFKIGVNSVIKVYAGGMVKADLSDNDPTLGTIQIGTVVKFSDMDGKNITGPTFASSATGKDPFGFWSMSLLPVGFVSFTAVRNSDNSVELTWTTAEEANNKHYKVERSTNSADWNEIATVLPGKGAQINSYSYNDKYTPATLTFYRIRQVDMDGKFIYSAIKVIKGDVTNSNTDIYAANKNITIQLAGEVKSKVEVRLISMAGNVLAQRSFDNASAFMNFSAGNISSGIYVVQVVGSNGLIAAKKIILN